MEARAEQRVGGDMKNALILVIAILIASPAANAQSDSKRQPTRRASAGSQPASRLGASDNAAKQQAPAARGPAAKPAAKAENCGCDGKPVPDVLATINRANIRLDEVDKELEDEIDQMRKQVIEARRNELGLQVNSRLLEAEARKLGITTEQLLEQEVVRKAREPNEAEVKIFYDDNKERIQTDYETAKPHIARHLLAQRQQAQAGKLADRLRAAADLKFLVTAATAPENEADRDRVFASVNGQPVKSGQIEDSIAPLIFIFQQRVYDMRRSRLESMINSMLIEQEAKSRNLTPAAFLEAETSRRASAVTDQDARRFYEQNRSRITGDYAVLKDQIIDLVRQQERRKTEAELAARLRNAASIKVFLAPPEPPAFAFTNEDQPQKGNAGAPVTIVEFTDFECPTCARTHPVLEELLAEYEGKVKLVVRDFPLDKHKNASKAAEAAESARAQGKYWEYIALMFRNQSALDPSSLKAYADQLKLDRQKFDSELDSGKYFDLVNRDKQAGLMLGINGTPALFVNGRRVESITKEAVRTAIEAALKTPGQSASKSAPDSPVVQQWERR
jgi:protein-disulfide isomerase